MRQVCSRRGGVGSGGAGAACARGVETVEVLGRAAIGVRMLQCFVPSMREKLMCSGGFVGIIVFSIGIGFSFTGRHGF
jgi:hypothetical protein